MHENPGTAAEPTPLPGLKPFQARPPHPQGVTHTASMQLALLSAASAGFSVPLGFIQAAALEIGFWTEHVNNSHYLQQSEYSG